VESGRVAHKATAIERLRTIASTDLVRTCIHGRTTKAELNSVSS
jgi:hypothetical protein